jgi:hypothetical protein
MVNKGKNPKKTWKENRKKSKEANINYREYIQSDEWYARRDQYFKTHKRRCAKCKAEPKYLHLHHLTYVRLGYELDKDLIALCHECHQKAHKRTF